MNTEVECQAKINNNYRRWVTDFNQILKGQCPENHFENSREQIHIIL